eukprot:GHVS01004904.1.p1 GENE.GHVS01004904.1~~GHVS01004904.1.p1  ORF type:complete len:907 (-),score=106.87 GHVS01004904.1:120-2840(-)
MLSWNYFAYALTLLFCVFQQVGLDFFCASHNIWYMLFLGPIDLCILISFLFNHDVDFAATRGGNCWVLYSWAITVKVVVTFFTPVSEELQKPGVLIHSIRGAATEVELLFLLAPVLYALLSFRGYEELFGGVTTISTESMFHGDLILHVLLDWWDVVAAFSTFLYFPPMIRQQCLWLHITAGVVICVAVFLHAYSFPTLGDASGQLRAERGEDGAGSESSGLLRDAGDVFVTRKHAALVGICVVDVPLMVFRIFLWVSYPTFEGFSPFIVKNITSIMMQGMRIWQVITATRLKQQRLQKRDEFVSYKPVRANAWEDGAEDGGGPVERRVKFAEQPIDGSFRAASSPRKLAGPSGYVGYDGGRDEGESHSEGSCAADEPLDEQEKFDSLVNLILGVKDPRGLPVDPIRHRQLARKIIQCARMGGRHSLAVLLDNVMHIPFWKLLRLAFPFMLMWLSEIAIVTVLFFLDTARYTLHSAATVVVAPGVITIFSIQIFDSRVMRSMDYSQLPLDVTICLGIVVSMAALSFLLWVFSVPFLDVLAQSIFAPLQLMSFFLVVLTFRDFRVFTNIFQIGTTFGIEHVGDYFLWVFVVEPAAGVLYTLYPFLCALLDKRYLGYVVPLSNDSSIISRVSNVASTLNVGGGASLPDQHGWDETPGGMADLGAEPSLAKRGDEMGLMTTSSLIVFLNCRFGVAPISLHELLIGPDLVKSARLTDALLYTHFRYFCLTSVVRLWCVSLYYGFPSSIAYGRNHEYTQLVLRHLVRDDSFLDPMVYVKMDIAVLFFACHIGFLMIYLVLSQVVRLLAIRRYETKAMFDEIAALVRGQQHDEVIHRDPHRLSDAVSGVSRVGSGKDTMLHNRPSYSATSMGIAHTNLTAEQRFETDLDSIIEKYRVHGFYTTPGDLLPNFF